MIRTKRKKLKKPDYRSGKSGNGKVHLTLHQLDWLEWLSIGLCIWLWFSPYPYKLVFALVLALPIAGLILNGVSRPSLASLVSISNGKSDYDLADFIEFPGLVILVRVLLDYEFESFFSILKVGTVGFILVLILLAVTHRQVERTNKNRGLIYFTVLGNIAIYSYAGTYGVNCVFDESEPQVYEAKVLDKSVSRGRRSTTYYVKVEPWGHHYDSEDISVAKSQYEKIEIGQTVSINYKRGLLHIPWYYVR